MFSKLARAMRNNYHGQKGMTGLETAIILIAFVTVASVLAYSVLSAGIFSSEKGKQTVYQGLQQAQSTLEVKGSVIGLASANNTKLQTVQFNIGLSIPTEVIDTDAIVINFLDPQTHAEGVAYTAALNSGSTERDGSASTIDSDEQFTFTITIPSGATVAAHDTFSIQIIPPTGATLTITRTMPAAISEVMNLD